MSFFSFFFQSTPKKVDVKRENPKIKDLKCENLNIWVEDITKIKIEISSLLNIFNKLDLPKSKLMRYITKDIIDLDPYRLPYKRFLRLKLKENPSFKRKNFSRHQKLISNVESKLKIKMPNIKRIRWVDDEVVSNNIVDFVRNRFYNNSDIKMFLLKYISMDDRKYKLFIQNKHNIIIDESINKIKPNKKIIKRKAVLLINVKGNPIYLNKVSVLKILKQSKIKESKILKAIIYYIKHIKQNYEIYIKYHKPFYPKKLKKKLHWIKDKDDLNEKLKRIDINQFETLISNTENYYNMIIEDENRRLKEVGLIPIKRSRSGDLQSNEIMRKMWSYTNKNYTTQISNISNESGYDTNNSSNQNNINVLNGNKTEKKKKLKNENNKKDTNFTITNNKINELAKLKEEIKLDKK